MVSKNKIKDKMEVKRGITLIEVIASIFILLIIVTMIYPLTLSKTSKESLSYTTERVVSDLKNAKTIAISNNTVVDVEFLSPNKGGFTKYRLCYDGKKEKEKSLPNGKVIITKEWDLHNKKLRFMPKGSIYPMATTLTVKDTDTNEIEKITLTIGYTRIMRVK